MADILIASIRLFEEFEKNNILYCHWKSNEHLYEGLIGETDLDVLVHPEYHIKAIETLTNTGYVKLISQYGSNYPDVEDWITCDETSGKLIHIHLHFRIATGHKGMKEYSLPWTDAILSNRIKDPEYNVYICPPDYEIIALYTRIGLKATYVDGFKARIQRYKFNKNDLREISFLKERINYQKVNMILNDYYGSDSVKMLEIINKNKPSSSDMSTLIRLSSKYMRKYSSISGVPKVFRRVWYSIALPARRFLRRKGNLPIITKKTLGKKRGITIAFMGQDGAGKTTITKEVEKWLTWKVDVRNYYLGNGDNYWSWRKRLSVKLKKFKGASIRAIRGILIVGDLKNLAKHTYRTICSANSYKKEGGVVIYDRYPQMQYYGINDGPKIRENYLSQIKNPLIRKYVEACAKSEEKYLRMASEISPDAVIKLILDPEVSIQRKPQENLETVRKKHEIIKAIDFPSSDIIEVDADQEFENEIRIIHNYIWDIIQLGEV